jgi:hypothetical protein
VPFLVSTVLYALAAATWSCAERQSGLPLKKGRAATMTRDYERHGTITLFAALDVKSGLVIGIWMPRRRPKEFPRFLCHNGPRHPLGDLLQR